MSLDLELIQGRYLADLLDQPEALRATWDALRTASVFDDIAGHCDGGRFQRVVLTGMGSSCFGLHPLCIELAANGWTPIMVETSELIHFYPQLLIPSTLLVAVSQSGKSAETVRLLEMNARQATVIGVTNSADSPLAQQSDFAVLTAAADEFSVSCKTYVTAQMALRMVAATLCNADRVERLHELEEAHAVVEGYLGSWQTHVAEMGEMLRDVRDIFLVGRGSSMAAASTGALTIKESDHFHAEGMSSAAFRHGPFEMLHAGIFVGVFAGDRQVRNLHDSLLRDLSQTPARTAIFSADSPQPACRLPESSEMLRPILEILPVQMMTLALAALAHLEPGKFERATKITLVE